MSTNRVPILGAVLLICAILGTSQFGAPNCKKGQPCGNSCISWNSTCHIGKPTPPSPQRTNIPAPNSGNKQLSTLVEDLDQSPGAVNTISLGDPSWQWVGSIADEVYFRSSCIAAQDLAATNRRYFFSDKSAQDAGFRRSRTPTC